MAERPKTRHVVITYCPDVSLVGTLHELSTEDASSLVVAGRARYATDKDIKAGAAQEDTNPASVPPIGLPAATAAEGAPGAGDPAAAATPTKATPAKATSGRRNS